MASILASVFGWAEASERDGIVTVTGVSASDLKSMFDEYFTTKKVNEAIFISASGKTLRFYSFFTLEVWLACKSIAISQMPYKKKRLAERMIEALESGTWMASVLSKKITPCVDISLIAKTMSWKAAKHQVEAVQRFGDAIPRMGLKGYLLAAPPGTGKDQPLSSKIKVPGGWKTMEDIQIGDHVTTQSGAPSAVTGVYPQGTKQIYELTCVDGRKARGSDTHLWRYKTLKSDWMLGPTSSIDDLLLKGDRVFIPLPCSEQICDIDLPADPYSVSHSLIELDTASVEDSGITIPDIYLNGSTGQRIRLLEGVLTHFVTNPIKLRSKTLAEQIVYLIRSLGNAGTASFDGQYYTVTHTKDRVQIEVKSVTYVHDELTQCIAIDDPEHLYVTDDFVVTHNTFMDLCIAATVIPRSVAEIKIVISPINAIRLVWDKEISECYKKPPKVWVSDTKGNAPTRGFEFYIFHFESMDRAYALTKQLDRQNKKYVVIIDESHNFNTIGTKRTDLLVAICRRAGGPLSIWASGSPIKALGTEAIPLLRSIDPKFTPEVEKRFIALYRTNKTVIMDILNRRLGLISYKIDKSVVEGVPTLTSKRVMIRIPNPKPFLLDTIKADLRADIINRTKQYKPKLAEFEERFYAILREFQKGLTNSRAIRELEIYKQYLNRAKARRMGGLPDSEALAHCKEYERLHLLPNLPPHLAKEFRDIRSIVKSFMLKVRGESLGSIYASRKAECAVQLALHGGLPEIIDKGLGKTLIFSTYSSTLDEVTKYIDGLGYKSLSVYGDTAKQVKPIVDKFQEEPEYNPMQASFAALSTAVPVFKANQVVMLNEPPRQYTFDQTVARAARKRQENPCFAFEFILDTGELENISTRDRDTLDWSREQVITIMGPEFGGPAPEDIEVEYRTNDLAGATPTPQPKSASIWSWLGF